MARAPEELERDVVQLVASLLKLSPVHGPIVRGDTQAWDSLKHVEIVFALEDRFDVQFEEDEFPRMESTTAIIAMVAARLGS